MREVICDEKHPVAAAVFFVLLAASCPARAQEASWPDLSRPARAVGGGEADAAVVVGIEDYFAVPGVPGAQSNAKEWYEYLTETRGVPTRNVKLLTNEDATREAVLEAARATATMAGKTGTLWFVFVGHGAPSADGKDGLLVGVDAQQKAESLQARSVGRTELLKVLAASGGGSIRVVLDACFSGRGPDGATIAPGLQPLVTIAAMGTIDPRMAVLTAAKGNQFAGALPGENRPAFSYLVLGGLRGWAAGKDGKVTAGSVWHYAQDALAATLRGRNQTPDLMGPEDATMAVSAGEKAPSLSRLAETTSGAGRVQEKFRVSSLPAIPKAQAPSALDPKASALDLGHIDVDLLEKYNTVFKLDRGAAAALEKAAAWRGLAKDAPPYFEMALKRAVAWEQFAVQQKAVEDARQARIAARDSDWSKLARLLVLEVGVVPEAEKKRWTTDFLTAYLRLPGLEPEMARELLGHVEPGPAQKALKELSASAASAPAQPVAHARRPARAADLSVGADGLSKSTIIIVTERGTVRLKLYAKDAPHTVRRFVELVQQGFYNGLTFHRVVPDFVVQGGDPAGNGLGGTGQRLKAEINARKHVDGALAMARSQELDSADSQFYITLGAQSFLDGKYTVFGQVVEGMDVVRRLTVGDKMISVTLE